MLVYKSMRSTEKLSSFFLIVNVFGPTMNFGHERRVWHVPWRLSCHLCCNRRSRKYNTKALKFARECCSIQHRLIKESYMLPPNNQCGESVYALLMNHIVAARVWSLTSQDFILLSNSNFIWYLIMCMHQEATILELMGNGTEALKTSNKGKTISSQRGSSFLVGRFHDVIDPPTQTKTQTRRMTLAQNSNARAYDYDH